MICSLARTIRRIEMRRLESRLCPFCGPGGAASLSNLSFDSPLARGPACGGLSAKSARHRPAHGKLRFLRTFLHYGGYWLRCDLRISGLSSVWGTSLPHRGNDRPGSLRLPGCLAALGTKVWQGGCEFEECSVRPCAPCRQYPFERPAGGLLHVPERQKKNRQFGGFA